MRSHDKAVVVDTTKGTQVITTFGAPAEREAVADWLSRHLALPDADAAGALPTTWEVRTEGDSAYVRKAQPGVRRTRALISWFLTAAVAYASVRIARLRHFGR